MIHCLRLSQSDTLHVALQVTCTVANIHFHGASGGTGEQHGRVNQELPYANTSTPQELET